MLESAKAAVEAAAGAARLDQGGARTRERELSAQLAAATALDSVLDSALTAVAGRRP